MEHNLQQLKKESARIALSRDEHVAMKTRLAVFIHEHPIAPQPRGVLGHSLGWLLGHPAFKLAPALLIVLIFAGGGISRIADESLPGDFLYLVKTGVNEEVKGLFSVSDEERAEYETTLAERRIDEIEKIAPIEVAPSVMRSTGVVSPPVSGRSATNIEEIEVELDRHIQKADTHLKKIESTQPTETTKKTRVRLEKILERQEKIRKNGINFGVEINAAVGGQREEARRGQSTGNEKRPASDTRSMELRVPSSAGTPLPTRSAPHTQVPSKNPSRDATSLVCPEELHGETRAYLRSRIDFLKEYLDAQTDSLGEQYRVDTYATLGVLSNRLTEINDGDEEKNILKEETAIGVSLRSIEEHLLGAGCPLP